MSLKRRDVDDGYRGWLYNPESKRYFRANATTARRTDLERVSSPDAEPTTFASKPEEPVVTPEVEEEVSANNDEASEALSEIAANAKLSDDKAELKALGSQVGVKLTNSMNPETMRDRIVEQVATIKAATEE